MTVGPFFACGLSPTPYDKAEPVHNRLCGGNAAGERMCLGGRVLDRNGAPINDALVEIWQADGSGRYPKKTAGAAFRGHGRCATNATGEFLFHTVKPGCVDNKQAPHINVLVLARGLLNHMFTRFYFEDEQAANAADAVLQSAGARKRTLIAARSATKTGKNGVLYRRDIKMSGTGETVFFDA